MKALEQKLNALDSFRQWSNYLLVTTVAALGWTAEKDMQAFPSPGMESATIVAFALSIVFAMLTLALIPHVAEDIKEDAEGTAPSIYHVYWKGWFVKFRLTWLCLPQHVLFLLGILLYATGAVFQPAHSLLWFFLTAAGSLCTVFVLGQLYRFKWTHK